MDVIGELLRAAFVPPGDALPPFLAAVLDRLEAQPGALPSGWTEAEFKAALTRAIPKLRVRARYLTRDMTGADDLVQDTLLRAWDKRSYFQEATNFDAWALTILRNIFFTQSKRDRMRMARQLEAGHGGGTTAPSQEHHLHLADVSRALDLLTPAHREVLMLVGAGQLSYEAAAEACQTTVGTIKSRTSRARDALTRLIEGSQTPGSSAAA